MRERPMTAMIEAILAYKRKYGATIEEIEDMWFQMYAEMSEEEVTAIYNQLD
jgi:hypothetical protein